eukprot:7694424-Pyramimonas_sp.AAC.1
MRIPRIRVRIPWARSARIERRTPIGSERALDPAAQAPTESIRPRRYARQRPAIIGPHRITGTS